MISKDSRTWNSNYKSCVCSEPSKIENYDKAIADTTQTWECHHRLETHTSDGERRLVDLTQEELEALDMYYHRPPEELIFLTYKDHNSLHSKGKRHTEETKRKLSNANKGKLKGKPRSEETKRKISIALKGRTSPNKGKKHSEETKKKMSESRSKLGWKIDPLTGKRVWYRKED